VGEEVSGANVVKIAGNVVIASNVETPGRRFRAEAEVECKLSTATCIGSRMKVIPDQLLSGVPREILTYHMNKKGPAFFV
jgi:hypothetical protein